MSAERRCVAEKEWIEHIARVVGWNGNIVTVDDKDLPDSIKLPHDWNYEMATDTNKIRKELGYREIVDETEALRRTIEWEQTCIATADRPNYSEVDALLERLENC